MEHHLTFFPESEIEIQVTLLYAEFEPFVKKAAVALSQEIEIEGFRKGKAPLAKVKERVGEHAIYERAANLAIRETYPKILESTLQELKEKNHREIIPIGHPEVSVTKLAPGNELHYTVRISLLPEVVLPDYKKIAERVFKGKKEISVTDEEIEKTLHWVRESRTALVTVDREVAEGDQAEVDFEVRHGGVKIEQGESRSHPVIIGKGKFIPGFEKELVGMKAGEEKSFTVRAPDDWYEKGLAGKALDFKVSLTLVQERRVPDLTDEFVKNLGNFSSVEALKKSIYEGIEQEKQEKERQRVRALVIDEIAKDTKTEVPEVLIETELKKMIGELQSGVGNMGMKWEDYMLHIKKNEKELLTDWKPDALRRVRAALVLREIANCEALEAREAEIEDRANRYLEQFKTAEEAEKKIDSEELREYTRGVLRNEKVFEFLEKME